VIQSVLTKKMKESEYILIIIGKESHTSKWMKWEIERSQQYDTKLKFAAVKINSSNKLPDGLPNYTSITDGFTLAGIESALKNAKN
jgi:hypothetical protein